jgi:hypothetical protein
VPVRVTSLYIRIPKTPRTEPGENDLHYCQRTTASGDCCLRPAGAERSWFGNAVSGWAVRLYFSKRNTPITFTTASLGKWTFCAESTSSDFLKWNCWDTSQEGKKLYHCETLVAGFYDHVRVADGRDGGVRGLLLHIFIGGIDADKVNLLREATATLRLKQ